VVTVELDEGAGIGAWDLRAARHAVAAVLRRRPEAYHETLRAAEATADVAPSGAESAEKAGAPASIHDVVKMKEAGLAAKLRYDGYERRSGLLRALPLDATPASWAAGGGADLGDPAGPATLVAIEPGRLETATDTTIDGTPVRISRELRLAGGRLDPSLSLQVEVTNRGTRAIQARLGLEWAFTMLGGGGNPAAWWDVVGARSRHDGEGSAAGLSSIAQGNDWLGVAVTASPEPAADAWWAPIETVSNSEDGFERVYQGSALLLSWRVDIAPGESFSATVGQRATILAERA
jgi:alpha-amylase